MILSKQQEEEEDAGGGAGSQKTPEHAVCTREQPPIDGDGDKLGDATADGEIYRTIRPTHKAHGASGPWKVDLRDAMSIIDPVVPSQGEDDGQLQHPVWTLKEIDRELRRKFSTLVLPHVPGLLPNPDITLALFARVV